MPRRLLRMMITMAGVWAIYWVYSLVAVPLIEPAAVATPQAPAGGPSPTVVDGPKRQIERLRPYFQPGDWELKDPIVMENPTFTLLMQGYRALPDKQIEIKPCTMIFFPDGPGEVQGRPARAVILQAPGGAVLDFDGECDLSRAKVGRLLGGRLVGEIKIHGNLSRGAAAGDPSGELHAFTHDLQLNQERIWTPHEVQFQLGPNHGSGRDLQILLVQANAGSRSAKHAMPRGIEAIELLRDVHLTAMLGNSGPLSGGPLGAKKQGGNQFAGGANQPPGQPAPPAAPTPVDIVCQGAFRFDMIDNVATFEKQVRVVRTNPIGPADDMACDLLAIHFTKSAADVTNAILAGGPPNPAAPLPPGAAAAPPAEGKAPPRAGGSLTATLLEARGNPVIVRAPSMQGEARGEHLQYKIQSGSLLLEGDRPIQLNYGPQQVTTRMMRYTPGPDGQPAEVLCEGAGQYNGVMPSDPTQHCAARWTKQLSLRPNDGKQLLSVLGDAKLVYGNLGSLAGDEIWFWLSPAPPAPGVAAAPPVAMPQGAKNAGPQLGRTTTRFQPHSMLARGHVHIDATQLIGRTGQLEVWFQQEDGPANRAAQPAAPGFPGQAAANSNNANSNGNNGGNGNNAAAPGEPAPVSRYAVTGKLTRVQFVMHEGKPTLRDVAISGKVAMHEELPPGSPDKPFHLAGDEVQLLAADAPDSTLAVTGNPAHVDARGLGLTGTNIQLDKASNRLWVDGQGEMIVMVAAPRKNPDAAAIAQPAQPPAEQPLTIGFTHGLKFDGRLARFGGPVVARTEQQRL
ncbi:MAG: hypothetical protein K8T25_20535, partial [Planctomycetia bacterium]|nr:hypothetical protein [Planctomycetia bacterium]